MERRLQQTQKLESLGVLAGGIAHDSTISSLAILGHRRAWRRSNCRPCRPPGRRPQTGRERLHRAADSCRQMLAYSGRGSSCWRAWTFGTGGGDGASAEDSISEESDPPLNWPPGIPPIQADAGQIRQIVMNLVINASEAIGERAGSSTSRPAPWSRDAAYLAGTGSGQDLPPATYVYWRCPTRAAAWTRKRSSGSLSRSSLPSSPAADSAWPPCRASCGAHKGASRSTASREGH